MRKLIVVAVALGLAFGCGKDEENGAAEPANNTVQDGENGMSDDEIAGNFNAGYNFTQNSSLKFSR